MSLISQIEEIKKNLRDENRRAFAYRSIKTQNNILKQNYQQSLQKLSKISRSFGKDKYEKKLQQIVSKEYKQVKNRFQEIKRNIELYNEQQKQVRNLLKNNQITVDYQIPEGLEADQKNRVQGQIYKKKKNELRHQLQDKTLTKAQKTLIKEQLKKIVEMDRERLIERGKDYMKKYIDRLLMNSKKQQTEQFQISQGKPDSFGGLTRIPFNVQGVTSLQQLYRLMVQYAGNKLFVQGQVLIRDPTNNKLRYITIKHELMRSFESFAGRIVDSIQGEKYGSDQMSEDSYVELYYFGLQYPYFSQKNLGARKNKGYFHEVYDIIDLGSGKDGEQCEQLCREYYNLNDWEALNAMNGNENLIYTPLDELVDGKYQKITYRLPDYPVFVFDQYGEKDHCVIVKGIKVQLYLNQNLNVVYVNNKGKEVVFCRRQNVKLDETKVEEMVQNQTINYNTEIYNFYLFIFDFETVYDMLTFKIKPISVQILVRPDVGDLNGDATRKYYYHGDDVEKYLMNVYNEYSDCYQLRFCAYNGSKFDFFLLYEIFEKYDKVDHNKLMIANNSILQMRIAGRHNVHDLCKFLCCSLDQAGKDFKCKSLKQDSGDLFPLITKGVCEQQNWQHYLHKKECEWINSEAKETLNCECQLINEFHNYGMADVEVLNELYEHMYGTINESIKKINDEFGTEIKENLYSFQTIGAMNYHLLQICSFNKRNVGYCESISLFNDIKDSQVAGRNQVYKKGKFEFYLGEKDVKSLYPFVYLNRQFPLGDKIFDVEFAYEDERIGFFMTIFDQSNLAKDKKILPNRVEGLLDWDCEGVKEQRMYLDTIHIKLLIRKGCYVQIEKYENNFYFSELIDGAELFNVCNIMKLTKEEQDRLPASQRNDSLRNFSKLCINSISGKVTEGLHLQKTVVLSNKTEKLQEKKNFEIKNQTNFSAVIQYEEEPEKVNKEMKRPIWLGNLIYSYAREYMYESVIEKYDGFYQDTDSYHMKPEEIMRFEQEQPHLQCYSDLRKLLNKYIKQQIVAQFQKNIKPMELSQNVRDFIKNNDISQQDQFGQFESDKASYKNVYIAKKCYFRYYGDNIKARFKGIKISKKFGSKIYSEKELLQMGCFRKTKNDNIVFIKEIDVIDRNIIMQKLFDDNKKCLSIEKNLDQFVDEQLAGQKSYILCSSIQKQIKGSLDKKQLSLYQQFCIKMIKSE